MKARVTQAGAGQAPPAPGAALQVAADQLPRERPVVIRSVNVSERTGTVKSPVAGSHQVEPTGLAGDAHAGHWHRQVSLISTGSLERFGHTLGRPALAGELGENLTISGVDHGQYALLDRLAFGAVELEVTQLGKRCHGDGCAIFRAVGTCVMPREGLFCRVLRGGPLAAGLVGAYRPYVLPVRVLTLSDRAHAGVYEDRSGPRLAQLVEGFFAGSAWRVALERALLPDDPAALRASLDAVGPAGVVFCTGGTGIGPRDRTPEVLGAWADKLLPGVMDAIRLKYGADKPAALLSRSLAGVRERCVAFALPGSVRAVEEYCQELFKVLEHLLLMLHGIDAH